MTACRIPAPQAQAFVVCRAITQDDRTGEFIIVGPVSHVPIPQFPADIRVAAYARATGSHSTYHPPFELRAADGDRGGDSNPWTRSTMPTRLCLCR